jgi:ABC-2 type transport system permease protein
LGLWHSLRRLLSVIIKEYKHIWFDPGFLFLTLFSPAVLLTLLSYVFSFDVEYATLAVINRDQSPQSFDYLRALTADGDITLTNPVANYDEAIKLFKAGDVDAVLVIPPGFGDHLEGREEAPVNLVVDGTDPTTAVSVMSSVEGRTQAFSQNTVGVTAAPFEVRNRTWFNPNLRSQHSMVPGLMALVLILPSMAAALGVTREKEVGTYETMVTTPIRGHEYLIGKLIVYLSLGLVSTLLALAVAVYWFRVPFRGGLGVYMLLTADYLFALMGYCLLLANFISSQRATTSLVLLTLFIPSFFLTGLTFPIDKSSTGSWLTAQALPTTHFITISRAVMLKALGVADLLPDVTILGVGGALSLVVSILLFSKKLR